MSSSTSISVRRARVFLPCPDCFYGANASIWEQSSREGAGADFFLGADATTHGAVALIPINIPSWLDHMMRDRL